MSDDIINDIGTALLRLRSALQLHDLPVPSAMVYDRPEDWAHTLKVLRNALSKDSAYSTVTWSNAGVEIAGIRLKFDDESERKRAEKAEAALDKIMALNSPELAWDAVRAKDIARAVFRNEGGDDGED